MAAGLTARVASRGFPISTTNGQTGAGALDSQGGPVNPVHGESLTNTTPSTLTGYGVDAVAEQPFTLLEGTWGLSGTLVDPDATPEGHAGPVPGWAGSYAPSGDLDAMHENSALIHSEDFGALVRHTHVQGVIGLEGPYDHWYSSDNPGQTPLQPLEGQIQAMGGRDAVQGYDRRNGYGLDAGHIDRKVATNPQPMAYLDPAERVFVIPQASGTFTPTDAVQGTEPWSSGWDSAATNYTDPSPYEPAPEPVQLTTPQAGGAASAGWWS